MSEAKIQVWIKPGPTWKTSKNGPKNGYEVIPEEEQEITILTKIPKQVAHVTIWKNKEAPDWVKKLHSLALMLGDSRSTIDHTQRSEMIEGQTYYTIKVNKQFFKDHGILEDLK